MGVSCVMRERSGREWMAGGTLPLVPTNARGLMQPQPSEDKRRKRQTGQQQQPPPPPPAPQQHGTQFSQVPSLPTINFGTHRNNNDRQRTLYLPPAPMNFAGVSGFDPQVAFDPGLKRISHALAPPSLVDRYQWNERSKQPQFSAP